MIKIDASKHKFQIQISPKPIGFSINVLSKSFCLRIFSSLQSFLFETSEVKFAEEYPFFGQFWLKLAGFSIFDPLQIFFSGNVLIQKKFPWMSWSELLTDGIYESVNPISNHGCKNLLGSVISTDKSKCVAKFRFPSTVMGKIWLPFKLHPSVFNHVNFNLEIDLRLWLRLAVCKFENTFCVGSLDALVIH